MQNPHGTRVMRQHLGQPLVALWSLVGVRPSQLDTQLLDPLFHHFLSHLRFGNSLPASTLSGGGGSRQDSPRAVNSGIKRGLALLAFHPLQNHAYVAHRTADKPLLTRECGRGPFSNDPIIGAVVSLSPTKVVVVVHLLHNLRADDFCDLLTNPVSTGIRIVPRQVHKIQILSTLLALLMEPGDPRLLVSLGLRNIHIMGRDAVAESS